MEDWKLARKNGEKNSSKRMTQYFLNVKQEKSRNNLESRTASHNAHWLDNQGRA